jgi:hypothetical protein
MNKHLNNIIKQFQTGSQVELISPAGTGFINDTFIVNTTDSRLRYVLQRKNRNVFTNIPGMMDNVERITRHLKNNIITNKGDPAREALTVIRTKDDALFLKDDRDDFWVLYLYINDHMVFQAAETPGIALEGGKGLGQFQSMLSDFPIISWFGPVPNTNYCRAWKIRQIR